MLAHDGYDVALIHFGPVFDEVEEPYLVHLAVDVLEIGFGNRYPFRLSGRTGSGCIKHRFALEQDIRFSVLHSGYIRSEVFVIRCLYLLKSLKDIVVKLLFPVGDIVDIFNLIENFHLKLFA